MTLKIDAKFEEKLICCFKTDKNLVNFDPSTQKSQKSYTLICSFREKYVMFDLKYRGVICDTMRVMQNHPRLVVWKIM